jgi:hypothetical protein
MSALLLLVLSQFKLDVFENPEPFIAVEEKDGVALSRREVKGNPYQEYRVEVATPLPVEALCVEIFEWGTKDGDGPGVKLHKVLQDGADARVVYDQIAQPVVANRDFALTVVRERLPDGNCRIRFRTTNDAAPPKPEGFVRMEKVWGEWRIEAVAAGGAKLTYTLFSDPAGAIPSFLVHGSQKKSARDAAMQALAKTKHYLEVGK